MFLRPRDAVVCCRCDEASGSLNIVFFFKNCLYFATSPSPALGYYCLYKNGQPIRVTVHSDLLHRCIALHAGDGLQQGDLTPLVAVNLDF